MGKKIFFPDGSAIEISTEILEPGEMATAAYRKIVEFIEDELEIEEFGEEEEDELTDEDLEDLDEEDLEDLEDEDLDDIDLDELDEDWEEEADLDDKW